MKRNYNYEYGHGIEIQYTGHEICRPGHGFGPFIRKQYLIHCIMSGKGCFEVEGRRYGLGEGQGFLIIPGQITYYYADHEDPWEYCWVGFSGHEAPFVLKECGIGKENPVFTFPGQRAVNALLELNAQWRGEQNNRFEETALFYQFLSCLYQKDLNHPQPEEEYIKKAIQYMQNRFSANIKIEEAAAFAGVDRTYLYKLFMKWLNISPQQYLIRYRIHMAQELLAKSGYNITQIALGCGFFDSSSFGKLFKKHTGMSPGEYRKIHRTLS